MPSARNIATLRRSSSKARPRSNPAGRSSQTVELLEVAGQLVVAPRPHDQQVPADLVAAQPGLGEVVDPVRPGGEQHDLELGVEQVEQRVDLFDHRVLAARVEERPPVLARRLEVVLAARRVGEHAVDVDDDRRARASSGSASPGPVLGEVRTCASLLGRLRREVPRLDAVDDRRVGERRRVAERLVLGDVAQQPAHDLARTGLRQLLGEQDRLRLRDRADQLGDVVAQLVDELVARLDARRAGSRTRRSPARSCRRSCRRRRLRQPRDGRRARTRPRSSRCCGPTRA